MQTVIAERENELEYLPTLPDWRTNEEPCLTVPKNFDGADNSDRPEVALIRLAAERKVRVLSRDWPAEVIKGWLVDLVPTT